MKSYEKYIRRPALEELLLSAVYANDIEAVKDVISDGADVCFHQNEALRGASLNGFIQIVRVLLEAGADPHDCGAIAIVYARRQGHSDVEILLKEWPKQ